MLKKKSTPVTTATRTAALSKAAVQAAKTAIPAKAPVVKRIPRGPAAKIGRVSAIPGVLMQTIESTELHHRRATDNVSAFSNPAPAKSAFTLCYTEHRLGHSSDNKTVVIAASSMAVAVKYLEDQGCTVNSANAVLDGAKFIDI